MTPLQPEQIALASDASVHIRSTYWESELREFDLAFFAGSVNGSCENDTCRDSTNRNVCNNYTDCTGSTNGASCQINNDSEPPIGP